MARSSSGATTLPTWRSGSTRVLRANTSYSTASPLTRLYVVTRRGSNREAPRFERVAAILRHARRRPGWIPNDVHAHRLDASLAEQALSNVLEDEVGRRAAHRCEGEVDVDNAVFLDNPVDHTEVDKVHGHLRVLDLGERRPEPFAHEAFLWALRNLWNSSWNMATISALRGPRFRQRTSTSSQEIGCLKSQRLASASNSQGKG